MLVIAGASVKPANTKFSVVKNEFELSVNQNTKIQEVRNDKRIAIKFNYIDISYIETMQAGEICDVIGAVLDVGELESVTTKTGKELMKRKVTIGGKSLHSIEVTLWGSDAVNFRGEVHSIVSFKALRISDFNSIVCWLFCG